MNFLLAVNVTDKCADAARHVHDATAGKVPESSLRQPPALRPAPVRGHRVDESGDDGAEKDVSVEVAPFGDGAGDDRGASGGECAL